MKNIQQSLMPHDADQRRSGKPVICYDSDLLPSAQIEFLFSARKNLIKKSEILISSREAKCFEVGAGCFFRIVSIEGPQVGDLNLWSKNNLDEGFFSGKTRAFHGTHLSTGDRMWSKFPHLRPLATITHDTLDWYKFDSDNASVHDVIGTRCDPYTAKLLSGNDYPFCCHSNLIRAFSEFTGNSINVSESFIHDVLNVFMCTGFTLDTHQYFMKASPARPGDFLELFAEIDLLAALSSCPGGDCSSEHSSNNAKCYPLLVEIFECKDNHLLKKRTKIMSKDISEYGTL